MQARQPALAPRCPMPARPAELPAAERNAQAHARTGWALGRDYALHGLTPPLAHLYAQSPLQQGWLAGRARPPRQPAGQALRQWLALRTHAWAHGRHFDELLVTPHYLAQLDTSHCPITREALDAGTRSIDRVRNDAAYAAGNLALMSQRANRAKGRLDHAALCQQAASPSADAALSPDEWQRLACLSSFVTPLEHEQAARLPLRVLPPNRLWLLNPIQALQALLTRQFLQTGWSERLRELQALLPSSALDGDFHRLVLALAPRALAAPAQHTPLALRWALEDAWSKPLLMQRWARLALQIRPEQAQAMVEAATQRQLGRSLVHELPPAEAGWALASEGYAH